MCVFTHEQVDQMKAGCQLTCSGVIANLHCQETWKLYVCQTVHTTQANGGGYSLVYSCSSLVPRPVLHRFLFMCKRAMGTRLLLYKIQVIFRLDRVKLITDHSEEVDVTGYHTVGMC